MGLFIPLPVRVPSFIKWMHPYWYVWDKPSEEKVIYLTFDDGPIPEVTEWVLDILKEKINFKGFNKNILNPKIHISYKRTYLVSSNNLIRATIDENIKYKKLNMYNENFYRKFNTRKGNHD